MRRNPDLVPTCLAVLVALAPLQARTFHVSALNGGDGGDGSAGAPYLTIQKAASLMAAGDTCLIHRGIYREKVIPASSGTAGRPIVFARYQNDDVFISAADPVTGWTKDNGAIWKAPMTWDLGPGRNQVFVNSTMMIEARVPNLDAVPWSPEDGAAQRNIDTKYLPAGMLNPAFIVTLSEQGAGVLKVWLGTADGANGFKMVPFLDSCRRANAPQDFLAGAIVHKSGNYWSSATGIVAPGWGMETGSFATGWLYIMVNAPGWEFSGGNVVISGKRCLLDAQKEWALEDGMLYFRPPGDVDPNTILVEAKRRQLVMDLIDRSYIELHGLRFLGGSIRMEGSNNCVIDSSHFRYLTHWTLLPNYTSDRDSGETAINIIGNNNRFTNSSIDHSAASGIFCIGDGNVIDNCLVHDCDYLGTYEVGVAIGQYNAEGHNTLSRCTMYNFGRSATTLSTGDSYSRKTSQLWTMNHMYNCMCLVEDGGTIYIAGQSGVGSTISYNWMHDMIRPWNAHHIYLDYGGSNMYLHHNVFWQEYGPAENNAITTAPMAHITYNNTSLQSPWSDVYKGFDDDERGVNALWVDSKYEEWGIKDWKNRDFTLLSTSRAIDVGNFRADSQYQHLKDYLQYGWTFYLDTPCVIPDSSITGPKPDLGAYEYGKPRWIPGHTWGEVTAWNNYPPTSAVTDEFPLARSARVNTRCVMNRAGLLVSREATTPFSVQVMDAAGRVIAARESRKGAPVLLQAALLPQTVLFVRVSAADAVRTFRFSMVR